MHSFARCAPCHSKSDSTHPKCAEGSLCILKVHRATARAVRPTQDAAPATTSVRKLESTAPATKSARKAPKCCACHEKTRYSDTQNAQNAAPATTLTRKLESTAPATKSARKAPKCCACHEKNQMLRLPRNRNLTLGKLARDCSTRMISIDFLQICSRESEPIVRQGQRERHASKRLREHSKQNTSKRRPLKRESHCVCNANVKPHETLRLRSETTRRARKTAHHKSSNSRVLRFPTGRAIAQSYKRLRTVANGCTTSVKQGFTPRLPR